MSKVKRTLFPEQHQFVAGRIKGSSYLSSVWIGCTAPLLNLPLMLWRGVVKPPILGLVLIVQFFVLAMIAGFRGQAHGFVIDIPSITIRITDQDSKEIGGDK